MHHMKLLEAAKAKLPGLGTFRGRPWEKTHYRLAKYLTEHYDAEITSQALDDYADKGQPKRVDPKVITAMLDMVGAEEGLRLLKADYLPRHRRNTH